MTLDARYKLETPEHVEVDFELVGPGSRFCAWIIDAVYITLLGIAVAIVATIVGGWGIMGGLLDDGSLDWAVRGWALVVVAVMVFLLLTAYHIFFETLMRGQTPGKRHLQIRAIRDDGIGMTFTEVLIRNLLRTADFLPVFYGLGGLICLIHPAHKRLGDLAAGTIVVKEAVFDYRARTDRKVAAVESTVAMDNLELSPEERNLLVGYAKRRPELSPEARRSIADRLARPLYEKYGGQWHNADSYIDRIMEARHHES